MTAHIEMNVANQLHWPISFNSVESAIQLLFSHLRLVQRIANWIEIEREMSVRERESGAINKLVASMMRIRNNENIMRPMMIND